MDCECGAHITTQRGMTRHMHSKNHQRNLVKNFPKQCEICNTNIPFKLLWNCPVRRICMKCEDVYFTNDKYMNITLEEFIESKCTN